MATLSTRDQKEMDTLNDDIRELKQENKKAFAERMRLEAQVNKLENLLTNNLNRRKDELVQALQQISVEDRKQQLKNSDSELDSLDSRIRAASDTQKGLEKRLQDVQKKRKKAQAELEAHKLKEREVGYTHHFVNSFRDNVMGENPAVVFCRKFKYGMRRIAFFVTYHPGWFT